jgi:hypothetical protein
MASSTSLRKSGLVRLQLALSTPRPMLHVEPGMTSGVGVGAGVGAGAGAGVGDVAVVGVGDFEPPQEMKPRVVAARTRTDETASRKDIQGTSLLLDPP